MTEISPTDSIGTEPAGSGTNRGRWLKSCDSSACAEVFIGERTVHLASTKDSGSITYTHDEWWAQFLADAKSGRFDL